MKKGKGQPLKWDRRNILRLRFNKKEPKIGYALKKTDLPETCAANDFEYCWENSPYRIVVGNNPVNKIDPYGLFEWVNPIDYWGDVGGGIGDFVENYLDMREAWFKGADKYFHCKANCEAAQRGLGGQNVACTISDTREWWDQNIKGYPASDSASDQAANQYGRGQGASNPNASCSQICAPYRPVGLPSQY